MAVLKQIEKKEISDDCFEVVLGVVKLNLSDTISRFINTTEYKKYIHTLEQRKSVIQQSGLFGKQEMITRTGSEMVLL